MRRPPLAVSIVGLARGAVSAPRDPPGGPAPGRGLGVAVRRGDLRVSRGAGSGRLGAEPTRRGPLGVVEPNPAGCVAAPIPDDAPSLTRGARTLGRTGRLAPGDDPSAGDAAEGR